MTYHDTGQSIKSSDVAPIQWVHEYYISRGLCYCFTLIRLVVCYPSHGHSFTTVMCYLLWCVSYLFRQGLFCSKELTEGKHTVGIFLETEWDFSQEWTQLIVVALPPHPVWTLCVDSSSFLFVLVCIGMKYLNQMILILENCRGITDKLYVRD